MANPNIALLGATYSGVAGVTLPTSGGGTATFPWVEGSQTVTENDTYDVTNLAQLVVNVAGSGSSPWTLIKEQESSVSTTSTSAATAVTIACGAAISTADKIVWVHVRDKAGKRAGYFYGSDAFFINYNRGNGSTSTFSVPAVLCLRYTTSSQYAGTAGQYGVYGYSISSSGSLIVRRRYNSSYSLTIDGTYKIAVYTLDLPSGLYLFE